MITHTTIQSGSDPEPLFWDPVNGLRREALDHIFVGLYRRLAFSRIWRVRAKRRKGGHTWKVVKAGQLPKRIRVEALLLGVAL